ncbi:CdaR family transcriptional regulator [Brachyspira hampsonii]|uniref:Sugar diacide regulator n=1 Tax=Brachyspira hampsonii 30446 TaxID=1289135 RepID=A0A2U4EXD6_9SPIR|nr:sugar diacid recognition domain-containing protein [Brachyspira hampsonii]EKV57876.1 sugar diacide regulator [Brachyspira hampsonii 30446]MBW5389154.1 CdaR family transcriptional regulator [Brachyspira hampsonii]MBW5394116.1 CdaR family transcriptional regulator [Brachyspira hampsonii]OEJ15525.1 CdaR family transcriptional regulator [Brachyspira hampsonii]
MYIDNEIAQRLLDKIMKVIDYEVNINIMNEYGEIIASGDKNRIGKIHLGALDVIKNVKSIDYFNSIDNDKESSRPGVNMPLMLSNELIGVVGVTGDPNEIKLIANIIKMTTEMLIEREIDIDKKILKQTNLNNYIYKIISKENYKYLPSINIWAENNGYSFDIDRMVCLIKLEQNDEYDIKKISEYIMQKIKLIKYFSKQDIISHIGNRQFIIIKSLDNSKDKNKMISLFFKYLRKEIKIDIKFSVMCGCIVNNLEDMYNSFEQANFLFNYIECTNNDIYFIEDYILEYIILNEGYFSSSMILKNILNFINKNSIFKETIITISKNDLNINKTCEELGIHRNTVLHRMKKIKEILCIDPIKNHNDRIKFYIVATLLEK